MIYYIKNTVNENESVISGYFSSLADAKKAIKECHDWYQENGTGIIYRVEEGLNKNPIAVCFY